MKRGTKKIRRRPRSRRRRLQRGGQVPTFHILIATAGRPTLKRMLDSLKPQLAAGDAVTIVFDGKDSKGKSGFSDTWKEGFKCPVAVFEEEPALGFWGHGIRNKYQGILKPETTYIMHADDDDQYTANAFETLRTKCIKPDCMYILTFKTHDGRIIPTPGIQRIQLNNVGTPSGVIPFKQATKGKWGTYYTGDANYYITLSSTINCIEYIQDILYDVMKE